MKMTVDANMLQEMFIDWDRNYYTYEACESLVDFYDEIDKNMELDIVAICCEWSEYGETPCLSWNDFLRDYGYILKDLDDVENMDTDEKIDTIIDELEYSTTLIKLTDSILVHKF